VLLFAFRQVPYGTSILALDDLRTRSFNALQSMWVSVCPSLTPKVSRLALAGYAPGAIPVPPMPRAVLELVLGEMELNLVVHAAV
jgi:hypothetical protein